MLKVISRKQALLLGLNRYYTGRLCKQGHDSEKTTSSGTCMECIRLNALVHYHRDPKDHRKRANNHHNRRMIANPLREILRRKKHNATKAGWEFNLTEFDITLPECCPICGVNLVNTHGRKRPFPDSISIDRIDSKKGYVLGNVAIICFRCNNLKGDGTIDEFRAIIKWLESLQRNV